jgi:hypothetical protein
MIEIRKFKFSWRSLGHPGLAMGLVLISASLGGSKSRERTVPKPVPENVPWETLLIKGEPQPTFRFAVAHEHAKTACYGYLYFSRNEIWYEVKAPAADSGHAFRYSRSKVAVARQWRLLGTAMPEIEFKFSSGGTYHFFRLRESFLEGPPTDAKRLTWEAVLNWEPLLQATDRFEEMVRLAEQRQIALAPKPVPTVTLTAEPSSVEKGQPVTLRWTSAHADSLDLEPGIGQVPASGSKTLTPAESATYTITVQGPGGRNSATQYVTVKTPVLPPTIVLIDPSVSNSGQSIDATSSPLTIRGVAMDNSGLPAVTINGMPANMRSKNAQTAEFYSDPISLQPGENKFEVDATNAAHAEAKVIFTARYTPPQPPPKPQNVVQPNAKALSKSEILDLLKGDVPSERVAGLVKERGINFVPTQDFLKEIRAAGGGDDLVDALNQAASDTKQ